MSKAWWERLPRDDRVLGWDIWNEPDNGLGDKERDVPKKVERANWLLPKAFAWARDMNPSQPLTSAVWVGNWTDPSLESTTTKIQLGESDVISFHNYGWPEHFEFRIKQLLPQHRPILCTEYMARSGHAVSQQRQLTHAAGFFLHGSTLRRVSR